MFELLIILSRYFFIFYIFYFLWQSVCYILIEKGLFNIDKKVPILKQRITIIYMHIKAFLILSYIPNTFTFNTSILIAGCLWLAFFFISNFLIGKFYKNSCPIIWNNVFFLMCVGIIILNRLNPLLAQQQIVWLLISCLVMLIIPVVILVVPKFERLEIIYLIIGIGFLSSTFVFGSEVFGSVRWIQIGGISFQPSEIVMFLFIFYLASVFRKKLTFKQIIFPSFMGALHVLILVFQRNLGGALIFFMTFMIIMYISTGRESLFVLGILLAILGSIISYHLFSHVRIRVEIWQNPWEDVYGTGNQIVQSLFALGTWGMFGSGLSLGMPEFVPVVARDLPFVAIAEELGGLFAIGIIFVYITIFYRGLQVALKCKRRYYSLLSIGFTGALAFQTFLIIGGTIKLIPLTGVTLPFVSYGGSSVFVSTMMIGIIQWIFMHYEK